MEKTDVRANKEALKTETIVALASASGRAGVAVIRVSGPLVPTIAVSMLGKLPLARRAFFCDFHDRDQAILDQGLALYFAAPYSFTGEDVLELQGHGGAIVIDNIISTVIALGARMARPGEFSERAFLNNKIDLTQAEAIADLIDASTQAAAHSALQSLQGAFKAVVDRIVESVTKLRIYVEAALDFPEEEIDFISEGKVASEIADIITAIEKLQAQTQQGQVLKEGVNVVLVGKPNVGKSSVLNLLLGCERAIVTEIAGTTRDTLRETIQLNAIPFHITDTAGIQETADAVEAIGIQRTFAALDTADVILHIQDVTSPDPVSLDDKYAEQTCVVYNKIDLLPVQHNTTQEASRCKLLLSAKTGEGFDTLKQFLVEKSGVCLGSESIFLARRRHLLAVEKALACMWRAHEQVSAQAFGELIAEELKCAQQHLGEITGTVTSDDLLGRIFSEFCIGK